MHLGKIKARIFLVAISLVVGACVDNPGALEKRQYKYLGENTGRVVTFDGTKKLVDNGHRIYAFKECDARSFRVCLYGEITLAIPENELKVGDTWEVGGSRFSVESIDANSSPSNTKSYSILIEPPGGDKMNVFFSAANGIWGLKLDNRGELFKSVEPCGLGCKLKK